MRGTQAEPVIRPPARRRPGGFTLIEALVVLAIVGVLMLLLLPAVQSAREAARRIQCMNQLRQLAVAAAGYETAYGTLPPGQWLGTRSCFVAMLPHLEMTNLYDAINQKIDLGDRANHTARQTSVAGLLCPSEWNTLISFQPTNSYAGNFGGNYLYDDHDQGTFVDNANSNYPNVVALREIKDGSGTTALFAEWLTGIYEQVGDPGRMFYEQTVLIPMMTPDQFCRDCVARRSMTPAGGMLRRGRNWYEGKWSNSLYDHGVTPNQSACMRKLADGMNSNLIGACSAGSNHPQGANVAFVDGHVQFVRDTIELSAWRAMGTVRGGDFVSGASP